MREIKFRAWESGKMYHQVRCGGMFDNIPTAPTVWNEGVGDWLNLTGQPHTVVMQYTGLKDKNGREIYEGDIIKFKHESETEWEVSNVMYFGDTEWEYPAFDLNGLHIESYFESNVLQEIVSTGEYDYEVIGNIYENPELLGGEQND